MNVRNGGPMLPRKKAEGLEVGDPDALVGEVLAGVAMMLGEEKSQV